MCNWKVSLKENIKGCTLPKVTGTLIKSQLPVDQGIPGLYSETLSLKYKKGFTLN